MKLLFDQNISPLELMLRTHYEEIEALHREPGVGVLTLIGVRNKWP
jgi:hypothetical protein